MVAFGSISNPVGAVRILDPRLREDDKRGPPNLAEKPEIGERRIFSHLKKCGDKCDKKEAI
jgi:hypothetical protein